MNMPSDPQPPIGSASGKITAPFTMEQVKHLLEWQRSKYVHPFTCCDHQTMEASTEGFICPKCGLIQTWCHAIMAEPMIDSLARMQNDQAHA